VARRVKVENCNYRRHVIRDCGDDCDGDFTLEELKATIQNLPNRKAAGPDRIHNEMIKNASEKLVEELLEAINGIWKTGEVPAQWKRAIISPLPKPGKPAGLAKSYRPVSLTSCLAKTMESLVVRRLSHFLETNELLSPLQSGFRASRSTADPLCRLVSDAQRGFHVEKPHERTLAALVDFSNAFDRVPINNLLQRMRVIGIPKSFVKFYHSFLQGRTMRVLVNGCLSKSAGMCAGVPQGTVSGPLLWDVFSEGLLDHIKDEARRENVQIGMFADDLTIWKTEPNIESSTLSIKRILVKIEEWSGENNMEVSADKTEIILFSNYHKDPKPKVEFKGKIVPVKDEVKLLGVTLDKTLTMRGLIQKLNRQVNQRVSQLRV